MNNEAKRLLNLVDLRCHRCGESWRLEYKAAAVVALEAGWRVGPRPGDTLCAACLVGAT